MDPFHLNRGVNSLNRPEIILPSLHEFTFSPALKLVNFMCIYHLYQVKYQVPHLRNTHVYIYIYIRYACIYIYAAQLSSELELEQYNPLRYTYRVTAPVNIYTWNLKLTFSNKQ